MRTIHTDVFLNIWHRTELRLTRVTHVSAGLSSSTHSRICSPSHASSALPPLSSPWETRCHSVFCHPVSLLYGGWSTGRRKQNCMGLEHCSRMYGDHMNFLDLSVNLKHGPSLHFPPLGFQLCKSTEMQPSVYFFHFTLKETSQGRTPRRVVASSQMAEATSLKTFSRLSHQTPRRVSQGRGLLTATNPHLTSTNHHPTSTTHPHLTTLPLLSPSKRSQSKLFSKVSMPSSEIHLSSLSLFLSR